MIAVFAVLCLLVATVAGLKVLFFGARLAWLLLELLCSLVGLVVDPPHTRTPGGTT